MMSSMVNKIRYKISRFLLTVKVEVDVKSTYLPAIATIYLIYFNRKKVEYMTYSIDMKSDGTGIDFNDFHNKIGFFHHVEINYPKNW